MKGMMKSLNIPKL